MRSWATALVVLSLVLCLCGSLASTAVADRIATVAGTGDAESTEQPSSADSPWLSPLETNLGNPFGVEIAPDGSLYICEVSNHRVWQLTHPSEPEKAKLKRVAGTGVAGYRGDGGSALEAELNEPYEIRFDAHGAFYFVEMQNHLVRKVDRDGTITTVAGTGAAGFSGDGGPAIQAQLNRPHSIALDNGREGHGSLFIADIGNHRIRRVDLTSGRISSFAGNQERRLPQAGGAVTGESVLGPRALYITGQTLWVALREGHSVWRIPLDQPVWQAVAGTGNRGYSGDNGPALEATFNGPKGLTVNGDGDIFVVDTENQAIRRIDGQTGIISTVAGMGPDALGFEGEGTPATSARLARPHGICVDNDGNLYLGDSENHRVRRIEVQ